jgi:predicted CXXCH cytochrome family protein
VHGNQVSMLKKSRCYLSSPSMSCSACHDVHLTERKAEDYSDRCLKCHKWQSCGASHVIGVKIIRMCIGCHMPMQETSAIVSTTAGRSLHTSIRSHWIKIYPRNLPQGGS